MRTLNVLGGVLVVALFSCTSSKEGYDTLIEDYQKGEGQAWRIGIAKEIMVDGSPQGLSFLVEVLANKEEPYRYNIIELIPEYFPSHEVSLLSPLFEMDELFEFIVEAIGFLGGAEASLVLIQRAKVGRQGEICFLLDALGDTGDVEVLPFLAKNALSSEKEVRSRAHKAIRKIFSMQEAKAMKYFKPCVGVIKDLVLATDADFLEGHYEGWKSLVLSCDVREGKIGTAVFSTPGEGGEFWPDGWAAGQRDADCFLKSLRILARRNNNVISKFISFRFSLEN